LDMVEDTSPDGQGDCWMVDGVPAFLPRAPFILPFPPYAACSTSVSCSFSTLPVPFSLPFTFRFTGAAHRKLEYLLLGHTPRRLRMGHRRAAGDVARTAAAHLSLKRVAFHGCRAWHRTCRRRRWRACGVVLRRCMAFCCAARHRRCAKPRRCFF